MKNLGILLVVLGVLALAYGGFSYSQQRTIMDVGAFKATTTERKSFPLSPVVGGIALLSGVLLLVVPRSRAS